jgi:hypothetical protein
VFHDFAAPVRLVGLSDLFGRRPEAIGDAVPDRGHEARTHVVLLHELQERLFRGAMTLEDLVTAALEPDAEAVGRGTGLGVPQRLTLRRPDRHDDLHELTGPQASVTPSRVPLTAEERDGDQSQDNGPYEKAHSAIGSPALDRAHGRKDSGNGWEVDTTAVSAAGEGMGCESVLFGIPDSGTSEA